MAQTWKDYTAPYRSRVTRGLADSIMSKSSDVHEVVSILSAVIKVIDRETSLSTQDIVSGLQAKVASPDSIAEEQAKKLLDNLGRLRETAGSHHMAVRRIYNVFLPMIWISL